MEPFSPLGFVVVCLFVCLFVFLCFVCLVQQRIIMELPFSGGNDVIEQALLTLYIVPQKTAPFLSCQCARSQMGGGGGVEEVSKARFIQRIKPQANRD